MISNLIALFQADPVTWVPDVLYLLDILLRIALSLRLIGRRRPASVTLAWLMVILILPFFGAAIYLLIGENRLGEKRIARASQVHQAYKQWHRRIGRMAFDGWADRPSPLRALNVHATAVAGFATLAGNHLQLMRRFEESFSALIEDIDNARHSCHLQFYIWQDGGMADEVAAALLRATRRGVVCRILVDAVGSKLFLRGRRAHELRSAGVQIAAALPVRLIRMFYRRADIRNHRKIAVIDWSIAYTGSQNLVDPRYFKQAHGVGQWVDVMIRMHGPAVAEMGGVFLEDWHVETERGAEILEHYREISVTGRSQDVPIQVVPSGPAFRAQAIHQLLLTLLYAARSSLVITTPYFVPDESMKLALVSAALRGVSVTVIVPEKVDSFLVRHASRSTFSELLEAGVSIALFHGGLLHTKSVVVDDEFCTVGSVNLDMRSFWLNFEISLFVYDAGFTASISSLQQDYLKQTTRLTRDSWERFAGRKRYIENVTRLLGPLL